MKILLRVILLITLLQPVFAQNSNVINYYKYINNAEIDICDGNLAHSILEFRKAYKILGNKMPNRHMHNYFMVSAHLNKKKEEVKLLSELKRRGWDSVMFEHGIYAHFSVGKAEKLKYLFNETLKGIKVDVDTQYCHMLDSLADIDRKSNMFLRSINGGILSKDGLDSMYHLTDKNLNFMKNEFSKNFPTDSLIGTKGNPKGTVRYSVILIHNGQGSQSRIMDSMFYAAYLNGDLEPATYEAYLENFKMNTLKYKEIYVDGKFKNLDLFPYDFCLVNDSLFEFPVNDSIVESNNNNRKKFPGLCSVEDLRKKIIHQHYHPEYSYTIGAYITNYTQMGMELAPRIKKRLRYLSDKKY